MLHHFHHQTSPAHLAKNIVLWCSLCLLVLMGCGSRSADGYDVDRIREFRAAKDRAFVEESWSPLVIDDRIGFKGLHYFPITAAWAIPATFIAAEHIDTVLMSTSTDELRTAIRSGRLVFSVQGAEHTLWVFQFIEPAPAETFFVPFRDATNGAETYELGRYVEVVRASDGSYTIDFNTAYNPYCAYNYDYSCPLVPYYNTLSIPITAGEQSWH